MDSIDPAHRCNPGGSNPQGSRPGRPELRFDFLEVSTLMVCFGDWSCLTRRYWRYQGAIETGLFVEYELGCVPSGANVGETIRRSNDLRSTAPAP
jgi:hypothetical protein